MYLDTETADFDITTVAGPRINRGLRPGQIAYGLVNHFDRLSDAVTQSRWLRTGTGQRSWFQKEIVRWLTRDGADKELVTSMMHEFFKDVAGGRVQPKGHTELWRIFVAHKGSYYLRAQRLREKLSMTDDEYWTGSHEPTTEKASKTSIFPTRRDLEGGRSRS